jgi:gamma-glutamylcysteine synthetase
VGRRLRIENKWNVSVSVVYDKEQGIKVARYKRCLYNPKKRLYTQVGKRKPPYTQSLQEVGEIIR